MFLSNSRDLAVDETAIGAALVRFQRGDDRVPRGVRPVIEESWRRCLRVGIDPVAPRVQRGEAARPRSARNQELLEASHAVMEQARTALEGCRTMLVLADAAGVVLHAAGDDNALATAEEVGLTRGSNWSEPARGTSGLGTSLYLGDALHVHGPEHYCRTHQRWTCSASVVRDPVDDGVLGALSVAGASDAFDPHLFPLVLASATAVRAALGEQEDARRKQLLEHALALLSRRSTTTGLMLFDRRGRLVTVDARARAALATLGAADEAAPSARVLALDLWARNGEAAVSLPFWLHGRWLEPVIVNEQRIGTIVKFPGTLQSSASKGLGLPRYKLRRVTSFVHERIGSPITLDDLANVAGVSRFHFHRQFRKSMGVTPHDYVLRARIERAKALLTGSDLTIGEVSGAVGFADQSHFSNIFRKLTATTPRGFRNSMSA